MLIQLSRFSFCDCHDINGPVGSTLDRPWELGRTVALRSCDEVAGAATRQSRRPSMTEAWVAGDW